MSILSKRKSKDGYASTSRSSFWGVKLKSRDKSYLTFDDETRREKGSLLKRIHNAPLKKKILIAEYALVFVGLIVAGTIGYLKFGVDWQTVKDEDVAKNYIPSNEVASMASSLRLTRKGKAIFYATAPELQKNAVFNAFCGRDGQKDAYTLGCYYKDGAYEHILIFNQDMGLFEENGLQYNFADGRKMTALHEMLHAAYDRMSDDEKIATCKNLNLVTNRIRELGDELKLYPDEQICTESFARVGSEYIARYNVASANISLPGFSLDDTESRAMRELSRVYSKYFDVKNPSLIDSFWKNENNLDNYRKKILDKSDELKKQYAITDKAVKAFYAKKTKANYEKAVKEVDAYTKLYSEVEGMISSYQKVFVIADSEKLLVGDGYITV